MYTTFKSRFSLPWERYRPWKLSCITTGEAHHLDDFLLKVFQPENVASKLLKLQFPRRGDRELTSFVLMNCMDPLFSLRGERWTISIPSGGIQEHKNS